MAARCCGCHVAIRVDIAPVVAYPCNIQLSYAPLCAVSQSVPAEPTSQAIAAVFAGDILSYPYLCPADTMS